MAQNINALKSEIDYYAELVDLKDCPPYNVGIHSATEKTMLDILKSPVLPLTWQDQPNRASPRVKELEKSFKISALIIGVGIKPAVDSLSAILTQAFAQEKAKNHDLESVLISQYDMLNVRYRKPTHGPRSNKISNHAWGTAIDFKIQDHDYPGDTGKSIPRFISVLLPLFNNAGWYSGIGFHDTMHFEVAEETITDWHNKKII